MEPSLWEGYGRWPVVVCPESVNTFTTQYILVASHSGQVDWGRLFGLFPVLRERQGQHGGSLSGGEQAMLAIARALVNKPPLLLMDEPSEGLAPLLVRHLTHTILELKGQGVAILLVEQSLPMAVETADRVLIISKGRVVYSGTPRELLKATAVTHRYLGVY